MDYFFGGIIILFVATAIFYIVFFSLVYYWHEKKRTVVIVPLIYTFEFFIVSFLVFSLIFVTLRYLPEILALIGY